MRQCLSSPEPTHRVNVVDTSSSVKPESHFGSNMVNGVAVSSRSAMVDSTHAFVGEMPDGRRVMVTPAPPALPQQIIPAHWHCPWIDAAKTINPEGYLQ